MGDDRFDDSTGHHEASPSPDGEHRHGDRRSDGDEVVVERRATLADATADDDGMPPPKVLDDRRRANRRRIDRMGTGI